MSDNPWAFCEDQVVSLISKVTEIEPAEVRQLIEIPPDSQLGDIATTVAFYLAKKLKKNPVAIANEIVVLMREQMENHPIIRTIETKGPYINIFLNRETMAEIVLDTILSKNDEYGRTSEYAGKRALIEFPAVNPSKPWHIGHARNAILGDTLANVLETTGYDVIRIDYINDLGLQIAQLVWKLMRIPDAPKEGEKYDHYLGRLYVEVQREFEDEEAERQIREIGQQLEDPNSEAFKRGAEIVTKCVKAQNQTAYLLGIYHHYQIWESSIAHSGLLEKAKEMMLQCDSIFKMEEGEKAGCIVAKLDDLDEFKGMKEPYKVLFRSDGTRTYTGADVAFQLWKHRIVDDPFEYKELEVQPNGEPVYRTALEGEKHDIGRVDAVFNVIAAAQAHPQKLIYNILELLGYETAAKNSHHVAYEYVGLEDVEFSGRKGTWVGYTTDDVLRRARELAAEEVKKRNPDEDQEFVENVSSQVAVGALRYFMLNASPDRKITFRWSEALDFDGDAGPYLQYSHARAQRILEKAGGEHDDADLSLLTSPYEYELIKAIARFPNEVLEVVRGMNKQPKGTSFNSNRLTTYGYTIATLFSKFYDNCPVLKADGNLRAARLALVRAFRITIANCLRLLGIPVINRM